MSRSWVGQFALAAGVCLICSNLARAEQKGDVKIVVEKGEKSITKGAADVMIVNKTGVALSVEIAGTTFTVPVDQEIPLKVVRGIEPLSITEYHWGIRGKPGNNTLGWIPWKRTQYSSRLGVRGMVKKHSVKKPGT